MSQPPKLLVYAFIALSVGLVGSSNTQPAQDPPQNRYAQDKPEKPGGTPGEKPGKPGGTPGKTDHHDTAKASARDRGYDNTKSADTSRKRHSHKSGKKTKKASTDNATKIDSTPK